MIKQVFTIDITSWTASFRYPNLISGFQPTLEVPPLSTVLGLINAAAGQYISHQKLEIGYYFQFQSKAVYLETIYQIDSNKGKATNNAKSNVIRREFLFDNFLRIYTPNREIAEYFNQPFYVGFNVGGYELGLMPAEGMNQPGGGGVLAYWGVANAEAAFERLQAKGAAVRESIADVGEGIRVATFFDPFGNVLGIIENPHFAIQK